MVLEMHRCYGVLVLAIGTQNPDKTVAGIHDADNVPVIERETDRQTETEAETEKEKQREREMAG